MDKYMIAAVFGPILILMGLSLIVHMFRGVEAIEELCGACNAPYTHAFISLVIGISVIYTYNIWLWDMSLLVTLFGWVMTIKGVWILFLPQSCTKAWINNRGAVFVSGIIGIIWGIALSVFAHH